MKQFALAALAPAVRASAGTIVFTQTQESSERSAEMLQQMGYTAAAVHAGLDQDEREERIDFFRDRTVSALTAPRILDEGVDVPEADLASSSPPTGVAANWYSGSAVCFANAGKGCSLRGAVRRQNC